ncbi:hypothetical protein [Neorhizobium tomejilense]|uniref:hypothetical protein n=1 Tax=Neorhizobium tomejilense TaxID=2093828 RepID=UPI000CF8D7D4|nr:hypothetical protein [Neorhizobium tomejilense]
MIFANPRGMSSRGLFAGMIFLISVANSAAAAITDLTIDVAGELLERGGVVTIYHLPVGLEDWRANASGSTTTTVRIERRYAEIQLRYPENGTFTYRFRAVPGSPNAEKHRTQVLSVIGTDTEGRGPQMVNGFVDAYSSGGRVIRIPPMAEIAGEDEVTRSAARWGETEGLDASPPADQRSARALVGLLEPTRLQCDTSSEQVQVCQPAIGEWPTIEARWWRSIAEHRLERLKHHALRNCYDSNWFGNGKCEADPEADEPRYIFRQ